MYIARTQPVLYLRLTYLPCLYFASDDNQYCTSSKPVECQLSMVSLHQSFTSTAEEYGTSSKPVICQCLAQYWRAALALLLGHNWHNTALVVKTVWPPTFPPGFLSLLLLPPCWKFFEQYFVFALFYGKNS